MSGRARARADAGGEGAQPPLDPSEPALDRPELPVARPELPVDRRVNPGSLAAYATPRPGLPIGAVALGTLVAWLSVPVWLTVVIAATSGSEAVVDSAQMLGTVFVVVLASAVPAALLGLPLGLLLARALRPGWHPLVHLAAFAALGALVALAGVGAYRAWQMAVLVPVTSLATSTGWLVVRRRLVTGDAR